MRLQRSYRSLVKTGVDLSVIECVVHRQPAATLGVSWRTLEEGHRRPDGLNRWEREHRWISGISIAQRRYVVRSAPWNYIKWNTIYSQCRIIFIGTLLQYLPAVNNEWRRQLLLILLWKYVNAANTNRFKYTNILLSLHRTSVSIVRAGCRQRYRGLSTDFDESSLSLSTKRSCSRCNAEAAAVYIRNQLSLLCQQPARLQPGIDWDIFWTQCFPPEGPIKMLFVRLLTISTELYTWLQNILNIRFSWFLFHFTTIRLIPSV